MKPQVGDREQGLVLVVEKSDEASRETPSTEEALTKLAENNDAGGPSLIGRIVRWADNPFFLALLLFTIYMFPPFAGQGSDAMGNALVSYALYRGEGLELSGASGLKPGAAVPYYVVRVPLEKTGGFDPEGGDKLYSGFGVGPGIFAAPFTFLSSLFMDIRSFGDVFWAMKFASIFGVLLSALLLRAAFRKFTSANVALLAMFTYALGTNAYSLAAQELWQHSPSHLCLTAMIFFIVSAVKNPRFYAAAGCAAGCAFVMRPVNALVLVVFGFWLLWSNRKHFALFASAALPPVIFQFAYNWHALGSPLRFGQWAVARQFDAWGGSILDGGLGLLISPSRGLFVFSPIFLLLLLWLCPSVRAIARKTSAGNLSGTPIFALCLAAALVLYAIMVKRFDWHGGWSYGPRQILDAVPFLVVLLVPVYESALSVRFQRLMIALLLAASIFVHGLGAWCNWYGRTNNWYIEKEFSNHPEVVWSLEDSIIVYYVKNFRLKF